MLERSRQGLHKKKTCYCGCTRLVLIHLLRASEGNFSPNAHATWKTKTSQFCNDCNISVITGPIALKLGMSVATHLPCVTVGVILNVLTCRVPLPDLEYDWAECAQIWHVARVRLVGCRAQVSWKYPSQVRTYKSHPLARSFVSPQKVCTQKIVDASVQCFWKDPVDIT